MALLYCPKLTTISPGGGIIGCCSAYFLTRHPSFNPRLHSITLLEATSIASGASGKAGGLLALWAYPSCLVPLSYRLHAELAAEHVGAERWGYRKVHCGSVSAIGQSSTKHTPTNIKSNDKNSEWSKLPKLDQTASKHAKAAGVPDDLDWFDNASITGYSKMGDPTTTAQVHPFQFTASIAALAVEAGVKVIIGSVTAIDYTGNQVRGVTYESKTLEDGHKIHTIPATDIVVAAGPWTSHVFPDAPIDALRAHSVTIKADVSPYAVFSEIDLPKDFDGKKGGKKTVSPEMYARPNGEVYACGEGDTLIPLPKSSDLVQCDIAKCDEIVAYVSSISSVLREGEVLVKQACYLPQVSSGGGPLVGLTNVKGLVLAAGHTCWGIQNGPGTGKLVSEFVWDGKATSADVRSLDPRRVL
jgi:glycine/D-amino acid oxidase-like deaminating enzyme